MHSVCSFQSVSPPFPLYSCCFIYTPKLKSPMADAFVETQPSSKRPFPWNAPSIERAGTWCPPANTARCLVWKRPAEVYPLHLGIWTDADSLVDSNALLELRVSELRCHRAGPDRRRKSTGKMSPGRDRNRIWTCLEGREWEETAVNLPALFPPLMGPHACPHGPSLNYPETSDLLPFSHRWPQ
jgi:hypothetical protein